LIWTCNAFEGGRIYHQTSRINHSCDPNAIVQTGLEYDHDDNDHYNQDETASILMERQVIRAAVPIEIGDEITISYLGLMLYAATSIRRHELSITKHFVCQCYRCTQWPMDAATALPCPICHPRVRKSSTKAQQQEQQQQEQQLLLNEDDQYDDDLKVQYLCCQQSSSTLQNITWKGDCSHEIIVSRNIDLSAVTTSPSDSNDVDLIQHYLHHTHDHVSMKVAKFLRDYPSSSSSSNHSLRTTSTLVPPSSKTSIDEDHEDVEREMLEICITMSSSIVGAKHWATNLPLLLLLDCQLQEIHDDLMTNDITSTAGATVKKEIIQRLGEVIDSLERICRYVDNLHLRLHRGHLLGNVIIGVARALVSFGDVKSQQYAATWLERICSTSDHDQNNQENDFVTVFETKMIRKVVVALQSAWSRHDVISRKKQRSS
jgi:hypothetical protein